MSQNQFSHTFDNGLILLAEKMDWLESASFAVLVPSGYIYDPSESLGLSNFTCEMVQRGCGNRDSRKFVEDLDRLGVDRSSSVSGAHTSFGGATLAENLFATLEIFRDLIREPHLPADQIDDGRQVCLQELWAVEDDLAQRAMQKLRERHYGAPWGRASYGSEAAIESIDLAQIERHFKNCYRPRDAIISVAGKVDWPSLVDHVGELLGDWEDHETSSVAQESPLGGYEHIDHDSNQTHIGVAFPSVPYRDPDYFQARGAVGVLSDGMSSRLFTEVREKRGLCYTVYATCHSLRDRASVMAYSGTSTDRAQETLDVLIAELRRLSDGVEADELFRLKARIKSSLIMQQESSSARASSLAADWFHLGRIVTMEEISNIIDGLSCDTINKYLEKHPAREFTVVTVGEKELEVPVAVS